MVLLRRRKYVSTYYIPTAPISASRGGYPHRPSMYHFGFIAARWWDTEWWNHPMVLPILRVITKVSETKIRFALTTALLKVSEVRVSDLSRPKILKKLAYLFRSF